MDDLHLVAKIRALDYLIIAISGEKPSATRGFRVWWGLHNNLHIYARVRRESCGEQRTTLHLP